MGSLGQCRTVERVCHSNLGETFDYQVMRCIKLVCLLLFPVLVQAETPDTLNETVFWGWSFLGRLHPMLVHFPIALIFIAFILECLGWRNKTTNYRTAIKPIMLVASVSAILSVIAGLLLANTESYGSDLLPVHQWVGIGTFLFCVLSTWCYYVSRPRLGFLLLSVSVICVTITGHYGAALTHGDDYLTSVLPASQDNYSTTESGVDMAEFASMQGPLSETSTQDLNFQVRSILAHHCYSCHGAAKVKGELRLDKKEFIFAGGENGPVINLEKPEASELIRRIKLPRSHKEAMPSKGKGLSANEIKVLEFWIEQGAPWPEGPVQSLYRVAELAPRLPELPPIEGVYKNPVDRFINRYFKETRQVWPAPVDDRIYLKRVYLDLIGLLPSPDSIDAFIADKNPAKRQRVIQTLLNDGHNYSQHWLTFWNDLLRNDYTGTGYITGGRFDITNWLYQSLLNNKPYDQFVKELISPTTESQGFIKGIQWRGTINSSQSTEMQAAQNVSQVFFGLNLKCASCHDSFISDWKLEDSYGFANLFSDSILQIARCDVPTGRWADSRLLYPELGTIEKSLPKNERLKQVAEKLVQPQDGRLYRTLVNRVWAQLFGRGLVEPVDAMDNEPWNQDLLDWLAYDFVESGYDLKKLIYTITSSAAYQLPSVTVKEPEMLLSKDYRFSGMIRKRMTAEQFADAIGTVYVPLYPDSLLVTELLRNALPGSNKFARAALVKNDAFLIALGRPSRETVTTSRSSQANLIQALELTNGTLFHEGIKKAAEHWKTRQPSAEELVTEVYRKTLGRKPTKEEQNIAVNALGQHPDFTAIQDFLWVMAMHPEFQLIY